MFVFMQLCSFLADIMPNFSLILSLLLTLWLLLLYLLMVYLS